MQQIVQGREDEENAWMDSRDKDTKRSGQNCQTKLNRAKIACPLSSVCRNYRQIICVQCSNKFVLKDTNYNEFEVE